MATESAGGVQPKSTEGTDPPEGSKGAESKGMTSDDFHRDFTAREKKLEAKFAKEQAAREAALEAKFSEQFGKLLDEKLAALKPKEPDPKADKGKGKDEPAPALKLEDFPEWKEHQKKLAAMEKKAIDAEARERAATEKTRAATLRSEAGEALTRHADVPADRRKAALALLVTEEGRLGYSDEGKGDTVVWREPDGTEVPLEKGLKAWAKTADARIFQPPLNPQGSGGGPGRGLGNGAGESVDDVLARTLMAHARGGGG
jgi:hypothetical protein